MDIIGVQSGLLSPSEPLSNICVSHFVCDHLLRTQSIYYHQCLHWSKQRPHQCDLQESDLCYYI